MTSTVIRWLLAALVAFQIWGAGNMPLGEEETPPTVEELLVAASRSRP